MYIVFTLYIRMGVGMGVQGVHLHPRGIDDVICCLQAKCTQSFALASGARTNCPSIYYKMSNISKISFLHNIEVLCQHWWHAAEDYMLR